MFARGLAAAAAAILLGAGAGRADDDIVRLGGKGEADVTTLGFDGDVDTYLAHRGGGRGGFGGGFGGGRGFSVGYSGRSFGFSYGRSFYGGGYYGGYRPYYAGYYRPYYGYRSYAYYRPYYYGYYRPYYSNYYYSYPYSNYYYGGYYYPCNGTDGFVVNGGVAATTVLHAPQYQAPQYQAPARTPFMPPADQGGTYRYDGGPDAPLPRPSDNEPASQPQRPTVPREGRIAQALPSPYTAYGETPVVQVKAQRPAATSAPASLAPAHAPRIAYPAYGEQAKTMTVGSSLTRK